MSVKEIWKRWNVQIICVSGGFLLYGAAVLSGISDSGVAGGYLERGDYGSGETAYSFLVDGLADDPLECHVEIGARQYTDDQADEIFARILEELPDQIKGDNESLQHVETDLALPGTLENGAVKADWQSDAPDILDSFGVIQAEDCPEEGADVWLTVELSDGAHHAEETWPVKVFPKTLTQEQLLAAALAEEIRREDENTPASETVKLPDSYEGRRLRYYQDNSAYRILPFLGILLAVLFYARERKRGEQEQKKRQEELLLDYADVVYQLMVFVGAGLTVSKAWERIVMNYEERRRDNRVGLRPAYEEMADTLAQMKCGVPEGQALTEFGQRCRLQSYLKLSSLLEQNRRTGTKNLTQLLQQEMTAAWEQQKNLARRLGEEAGTKLLMPLMLLLLVIMAVIMVPAMMSM